MKKLKEIWKDPVWSKVISAGIISLLILIYNAIDVLATGKDFKTSVITFWNFKVSLWIIAIAIIILGIIFTIVKKIKKVKKVEFIYDEKTLELDTALFNKIRNNMLTIQNIYWLRTNNFAGYSFRDELLRPFDLIEVEMERPDLDFFYPKLESLKEELLNYIRDFNSFLLPNVFSEGDQRLSVPSEWEMEQPERFNIAVEGIHKRAQSIAAKYDEFIKKGRQILKVQ